MPSVSKPRQNNPTLREIGIKITRVILGENFDSKLAVTMAMADYSQSYSSEIDFKVLIGCLVNKSVYLK